MKKTLLALSFVAVAGSASAAQVEWDFSPNTPASNVPVNEFVFAYNSQSLVFDTDGSGDLSVGDKITSFGGLGTSGFDALLGSPLTGHPSNFDDIGQNIVTGFNPNIPFPSGYNSDYSFSFYFNNLMGEWDGTDFVYTSGGTISFGMYSFNPANTGLAVGFHNLFDVDLSFGGGVNVGGQQKQVFLGTVGNFQNNAGTAFTATTSWGQTETLADWAAMDKIYFKSNQTVTAGVVFPGAPSVPTDVVFNNGVGLIAANHTGRFSINVPEPASVAILGLGLLGLAGAARRRKA